MMTGLEALDVALDLVTKCMRAGARRLHGCWRRVLAPWLDFTCCWTAASRQPTSAGLKPDLLC